MPKSATGKILPELKVDVLLVIARNPGVYGIDICKEFPRESRTRIYKLVRQLRREELVNVTDTERNEYEHFLTAQGEQWLYRENARLLEVAIAIRQVLKELPEKGKTP